MQIVDILRDQISCHTQQNRSQRPGRDADDENGAVQAGLDGDQSCQKRSQGRTGILDEVLDGERCAADFRERDVMDCGNHIWGSERYKERRSHQEDEEPSLILEGYIHREKKQNRTHGDPYHGDEDPPAGGSLKGVIPKHATHKVSCGKDQHGGRHRKEDRIFIIAAFNLKVAKEPERIMVSTAETL